MITTGLRWRAAQQPVSVIGEPARRTWMRAGSSARRWAHCSPRASSEHVRGRRLTGEVDKSPARGSSTSATTAISSRCASTTGRSCSWSSAAPAPSRSGPSRSRRCGCRSCSTCAPIRTNGPTSRRTRTGTGSSRRPTLVLAAQFVVTDFVATFERVPAPPEGGQLHDRPGAGEDGGGGQRPLSGSRPGRPLGGRLRCRDDDRPTRRARADGRPARTATRRRAAALRTARRRPLDRRRPRRRFAARGDRRQPLPGHHHPGLVRR